MQEIWTHQARAPRREGAWRLGAVSFLNARPLLEGLADAAGISVIQAVPSALPEELFAGRVDAALVPVVDALVHGDRLRVISDACIGCDGETLTVRVFSRVPPDAITRLAVDGDSHTSVLLARVLWAELHGRGLQITPLPAVAGSLEDREAVLLIGDKVVARMPRGFGYEIDLGGAWRELTGLPFVFAVWACLRQLPEADELGRLLNLARNRGQRQAERIAREQGPALGWPIDLALTYLTRYLRFQMTLRHYQAVERLLEAGRRLGFVPPDARLPEGLGLSEAAR
jgi:chorismate dehydratase